MMWGCNKITTIVWNTEESWFRTATCMTGNIAWNHRKVECPAHTCTNNGRQAAGTLGRCQGKHGIKANRKKWERRRGEEVGERDNVEVFFVNVLGGLKAEKRLVIVTLTLQMTKPSNIKQQMLIRELHYMVAIRTWNILVDIQYARSTSLTLTQGTNVE